MDTPSTKRGRGRPKGSRNLTPDERDKKKREAERARLLARKEKEAYKKFRKKLVPKNKKIDSELSPETIFRLKTKLTNLQVEQDKLDAIRARPWTRSPELKSHVNRFGKEVYIATWTRTCAHAGCSKKVSLTSSSTELPVGRNFRYTLHCPFHLIDASEVEARRIKAIKRKAAIKRLKKRLIRYMPRARVRLSREDLDWLQDLYGI